MADESPKDIFLSYVVEDKGEVERLARELQEQNVSVWFDGNDHDQGLEWKLNAWPAIESACAFVSCLSDNWRSRPHGTPALEELNVAVQRLRGHEKGSYKIFLVAVTKTDYKPEPSIFDTQRQVKGRRVMPLYDPDERAKVIKQIVDFVASAKEKRRTAETKPQAVEALTVLEKPNVFEAELPSTAAIVHPPESSGSSPGATVSEDKPKEILQESSGKGMRRAVVYIGGLALVLGFGISVYYFGPTVFAKPEAVVDTPRAKRQPKAVLLVLSPEGSAAADDMREGFQSIWKGVFKVGDLSLTLVPITDGPEPKDTIARLRAMEKDYEFVLAVGHESSSLAKDVCKDYYLETGLPVILLGATNPDITKEAAELKKKLILRLLPVDTKQERTIKRLVDSLPKAGPGKRSGKRVLIASDMGNPVYSQSLTRRLTSDSVLGKSVVATFEVSCTNVGHLDFQQLARFDADAIIFVGMTDSAKVFVRAWEEAMPAKADADQNQSETKRAEFPALIFTDGCAAQDFEEFTTGRRKKQPVTDDPPRDFSRWGDLYVVSPMPIEFDYEPLGMQACCLARWLIYRVKNSGDEFSRESFARQVEEAMDEESVDLTRLSEAKEVRMPDQMKILQFKQQRGSYPGDNAALDYQVFRLDKPQEKFNVHFVRDQ